MTLFGGKTLQTPAKNGNEYLQSIIENLNWVLNTKRGFGHFVRDFGISDLNECTSRDALVKAVMQEVRRNIEHYEPRLQLVNISVKENSNPFRIAFNIDCFLKSTQQALVMEFNSVLSQFKVQNPEAEAADVR